MKPKNRIDFDSPWKDAIGRHFSEFLAFFFLDIHQDVDWSTGYTLLDKELHKIVPDSAQGRRDADLLVRLYRRSGKEQWVLIHVEVLFCGDQDLDWSGRAVCGSPR